MADVSNFDLGNGESVNFKDAAARTALGSKTNKVINATNGNFAGLDSNGNLTDSGKKASDFLSSNTPIPSITNCYQSTDTAEAALADDDYFPFYDTSESGKRKTLWSSIKWKIYEYITSHFRSGLINDNGYISTETSNFSVEDSGTASQNSIREQVINYTTNSVGGSAISMVTINGSKYMEQTITLSTSSAVSATFTNSAITNNSEIRVYAGRSTGDVSGAKNQFPYDSVYTTNGSCVVTFPKESSAISIKVRIYIKG